MGDDRHEWYGATETPAFPDVDEYACAKAAEVGA